MAGEVVDILDRLPAIFSGEASLTITLLFFTAVIVIYSVFIYYFYTFLAKRNIIEFNLKQYNLYENPILVKFFAVVFYIIEYIVLLPIMTFFWFAVLAILILLLADGLDAGTILLISAALVASVRVASYVSEILSKDLAKMIPFTLLAIAITKHGFFDVSALLSRIGEIPLLFSNLPYYLLFIVAVEMIMRFFEIISEVFNLRKKKILKDDDDEEEEE
ncbi:MAG: hypothetical protein NUV97_01505 [archaeon]|nr:hypothetical protein [archaeon]MCR4323630.1 hypothetical protein [Nanoarchaeota archaeon]